MLLSCAMRAATILFFLMKWCSLDGKERKMLVSLLTIQEQVSSQRISH